MGHIVYKWLGKDTLITTSVVPVWLKLLSLDMTEASGLNLVASTLLLLNSKLWLPLSETQLKECPTCTEEKNSKSFKTHQVVTLYTPRTEPLDFALSKLHKLSSWDSMTTNSNLDKPTTLFTELLTTQKLCLLNCIVNNP